MAARIRDALRDERDVVEKRMFGGVCFMVHGHMALGVANASLMVRVAPDDADRWLAEPGARVMDFTGRPMRGFLFVDAAGVAGKGLRKWVERGVAHAALQPPKKKGIGSRRGARKKR